MGGGLHPVDIGMIVAVMLLVVALVGGLFVLTAPTDPSPEEAAQVEEPQRPRVRRSRDRSRPRPDTTEPESVIEVKKVLYRAPDAEMATERRAGSAKKKKKKSPKSATKKGSKDARLSTAKKKELGERCVKQHKQSHCERCVTSR